MITWYELGFPMGRDFLVPQDKGTDPVQIPSPAIGDLYVVHSH